jgi:hypothetical protein
MKFSRIGRRLWRRPRPKLGCGAKESERERALLREISIARLCIMRYKYKNTEYLNKSSFEM